MNTGRMIVISIITAAFTSAAVTIILGTLATGRSISFSSADIEVPSVMGLRPDQARMLLEGRSLFLLISDQREDAKIEAGHIIQQNPMEGSRIKKGSNVQVVLSTGLSKSQVPGIVGLTSEEAQRALINAGFKPGSVSRQASDSVAAEHVITSLPVTGEMAQRGSAVDLVVSSGKDLVIVPNVVGKGLKQAKDELAQAGFQVGNVSYSYDEDRRGGLVLKEEPAAGEMADKGAKINLVVNESD